MALPARHHGRLSLELAYDNGQTTIVRQRSCPPLQIFGLQQYADSGGAYLQIVNPTGGLFEGDSAAVEVTLQQGAQLYLTTQAATKIYPAEHGALTRQWTRLRIAPGALLEYFPLPLMPFARARYAQEMTVEVEPGGVCLMAEVLAPGRLARGERFAYHIVRSRVQAWVGGQLALYDQIILEPPQHAYEGLGLLEGLAYVATLYVLTSQPLEAQLPVWNRHLMRQYDGRVGIAGLAYGGLVVRLLGNTGQEVLRRLAAVRRLIRREGLGMPAPSMYQPYA